MLISGGDNIFPYAQVFVVLVVLTNIYLLWKYRKEIKGYRKALTTPLYHWLFHVLLFYLVTTPVRFYTHPNLLADDLLTYWSLIVRLHGQIALIATFLGMASREGLTWKNFLPKVLRWRS